MLDHFSGAALRSLASGLDKARHTVSGARKLAAMLRRDLKRMRRARR